MSQERVLGKLESILSSTVCNIVVPCSLSLKRAINEAFLEQAVNHVIKTQPNLRSGVVTLSDGSKVFQPITLIHDVFEVLPSTTDWKSICLKYSRQHLREDSSKHCLLKVFYIPFSHKKSYMILVYHHCIGDGTNGMSITNDILTAYIQLCKGVTLEDAPHNPSASVEVAVRQELGDRFDSLRQKVVDYNIAARKRYNCLLPVDIAEPKANAALYFTSTEEEYTSFLMACKNEGVTVGNVLIAAMYFGYCSLLFDELKVKEEVLHVGCSVPANMRGRLKNDISKNTVNLYIAILLIEHAVSLNTNFLQFCRDIKDDFNNKFINCQHMFDMAVDAKSMILEDNDVRMRYDETHRWQELCVSNMLK